MGQTLTYEQAAKLGSGPKTVTYEEAIAAGRSERVTAGPNDRVESSGWDLIANELMQFPAGFNEALADVIDAPSRAMTAVQNPIREAIGLRPITGEEAKTSLGNVVRGANFAVPEPETAFGRINRRAGQEVGYTVPFAAGPATAALALSPTARASSLSGEVLLEALKPFINSPKLTAAGEFFTGTFAGVGGGVAREINNSSLGKIIPSFGEALAGVADVAMDATPLKMAEMLAGSVNEALDKKIVEPEALRTMLVSSLRNIDIPDGVVSEIVGQLFGGMIPGLMPTGIAMRMGARALRGATEEAVDREAQNIASKAFGGKLTPEAEQALRDSGEVVSRIPGFKPSLAERTGDAALVATQEGVEQGLSDVDLRNAVARHTRNAAAVDQFGKRQAPQTAPDPTFVVDAAKGRIDDIRARADRLAKNVTERRKDLAETELPVTDRKAQGETLRSRLDGLKEQARDDMVDRSKDLGIDGIDATEPFLRWADDVGEALEPTSVFQDAKKRPASMADIDRISKKIRAQQKARGEAIAKGKEPPEVDALTFEDVKALRERLTDDLLDELDSTKKSRKRVRNMTILKARVDDLVDDIGKAIEDPELAQRYAQFRKEYFEEYIQRFERGVTYKIQKKERGFYKTLDEEVALEFFQPGNVTAAKQYNATFADDPEAMGAMVATVLDSLGGNVVKDGVIDQRAFARWQKQHASVLAEMPGIQQIVRDIDTANNALAARQQQMVARTALIKDKQLVKALDAFVAEGKNAEAVVARALTDPRLMKRMVGILRRNPDALESLKRHLWDEVTQNDAKQMVSYLRKHGDALTEVLGGDHAKDIATIYAAKEMMERVRVPTGQAVKPHVLEGLEKIVGQPLPVLGSRVFAYKAGRMQKGYLVLDGLLRGLRGRAIVKADEVIQRALYDEKLARALANTVMTGKTPPSLMKQLQGTVFDLGYGATVRGGLGNVGSPLRSEESERNLETP